MGADADSVLQTKFDQPVTKEGKADPLPRFPSDTLIKQGQKEMAGVQTKHTGPELKVRSAAHGPGYRFTLHGVNRPFNCGLLSSYHSSSLQ